MAKKKKADPLIICHDSRECYFKDDDGNCRILRETYKKDGECNFAKKDINDRRSYNHQARKLARGERNA